MTTPAQNGEGNARCAQCGAAIVCRPGADCWCAALPFRPLPAEPGGCLCRACLERQPPAR